MTEDPAASRIELRPGPSSPALARRFVRERAAAWSLPEPVGEQLALVGSELVTNAVLHARTPLTVALELQTDRVRISVSDQSSAPVAQRHYHPDALTGRGLGVVAAVSRSWGVEPARDGKVIWAELVIDGRSPGTPAGPPPRRPAEESPPTGAAGHRPIRFPAVPVADYLELQEHNDALFRELQLIRIRLRTQGGEEVSGPPPRLLGLVDRLLAQFRSQRDIWREEIARAQARGAETVDLEMEAPAAAVAAAGAYVDLLEEADEFCRTGELLTPPPPERVRRLRRWFVEQMAAQLR
jgi:anti-sigma regulatory factor (Ser/Thr protein kinase)